jgi:hypothetical protein
MKIGITLLFFVLTTFGARSQSDDLGVFLGASYYTGDLNPYGHFNQNTNPAIGLVYRHNTREQRISYRLHAMYGKIEGYDHQSTNDFRKNRDLNFSSEIFEAAFLWEINFFKYELGNLNRNYFSPYLFMGIAYYHFDPHALANDNWYELQPLGTEGQNTSANSDDYYQLNQFSVPLGIGIKMNISKSIGIAIEYGVRKTFTDYLDDVSKKYVDPSVLEAESGPLTNTFADRSYQQIGDRNIATNRGESELNDWYYFAGITVNFVINRATECGTNFR